MASSSAGASALRTALFKAKKSLSLSSRFSSGDLSSELDDEPSPSTGLASVGRQDSAAAGVPQNYQGLAERERPLQSQPQPIPPPSQPVPGAPPPGNDLSLNLRPSSRTTSAPSSPAKTRESLLQRVQSLTGAARDQASCYSLIFTSSYNYVPYTYSSASFHSHPVCVIIPRI